MSSSFDVYRFFDRHPSFDCILPLSSSSYLVRSGSTFYSCHHFVTFHSLHSLYSLYLHFLTLSQSTFISLPPLSEIFQLPDNSCLLITEFISGRRPSFSELSFLLPEMVSFGLTATSSSPPSDHLIPKTPNSFELLRAQIQASPCFHSLPACLSRFLLLDPPHGSLSFCHGDFLPQNLVIDRHDNVFLIDWELTGLSIQQFDLGWLNAYCILSSLSLPFAESSYPHALDYFTRFGLVRFAYRILQQSLPQKMTSERMLTIISLFNRSI